MANLNMMYKVKNRSSGRVCYSVFYNGNKVNQSFNPGEEKLVSFEELRQLAYQSGGPGLIYNYLLIGDKITDFVNIKPEPEYYMDDEEVKDLLVNGSLDAFLDCLDFAPIGVLDLVKKYAVEMPLNDFNKRRAITERLGFNVDKAIANNEATKADVEAAEAERTPTRRTTPKYTVVNKQE